MVINIIGMLIGLIVIISGFYYLVKEGKDPDSKKIYSIISLVGVVIVIAFILRILFT